MDIIAAAASRCDEYIAEAVERARTINADPKLKRGVCNYCDEPLTIKHAVFCDIDCSTDFERIRKNKARLYQVFPDEDTPKQKETSKKKAAPKKKGCCKKK